MPLPPWGAKWWPSLALPSALLLPTWPPATAALLSGVCSPSAVQCSCVRDFLNGRSASAAAASAASAAAAAAAMAAAAAAGVSQPAGPPDRWASLSRPRICCLRVVGWA
jgi:hypothetical protein